MNALPDRLPSDLEPAHRQLFPIREVSRLTGVNPVTLRAWERRYGLIQPVRTASGHRLYSQADIDTVACILDWIGRGVSVSKVGSLIARREAAGAQPWVGAGAAELSLWWPPLREAVRQFDVAALERLWERLSASLSVEQAFGRVLLPLWRTLRLHQARYGEHSEWLFFDQFLRLRVLACRQPPSHPARWHIVLAPLSAHCMELELLVAGLSLQCAEVQVTQLAIGQPLQELALVCERLGAQALVLFDNHYPDGDLGKRLTRLAQRIEGPVLLAGEVVHVAQDRLAAVPIGWLASEGPVMRQRLLQGLAGQIDLTQC
ncbi:MerR family transcriptional regulator [Pseudomonas sp. S75]|uniref:MerR family transcriptional regulator n=1 Tax=unclassified Pseudomonas TaxID=196821 RepID=UPI001906387B|nr:MULTISPECIES: MerR family transcriptional regulator [unclassified Pseudomonas]MBJ9978136.1 MerR family transcriptional regulator [Pseudomonas sp. S30]MBK0155967.1 MerR family transcriptional regulator [Pseudomonas sp. S75]